MSVDAEAALKAQNDRYWDGLALLGADEAGDSIEHMEGVVQHLATANFKAGAMAGGNRPLLTKTEVIDACERAGRSIQFLYKGISLHKLLPPLSGVQIDPTPDDQTPPAASAEDALPPPVPAETSSKLVAKATTVHAAGAALDEEGQAQFWDLMKRLNSAPSSAVDYASSLEILGFDPASQQIPFGSYNLLPWQVMGAAWLIRHLRRFKVCNHSNLWQLNLHLLTQPIGRSTRR